MELRKLYGNLKAIISNKFAHQNNLTAELTSLVKSSIRRESHQSIIVDPTFVVPNFPFSTTEDFLNFNSDLQNETFMNQIVSIFVFVV